MGQLKRRRPQHLLRPDEMLATLASLRLHALLQHGGLWLAVTPAMSELLNQCCTGQMEGGPGTAEEVAAVLAPLVGEPQPLQAARAGAAQGASGGGGGGGGGPTAEAAAAVALATAHAQQPTAPQQQELPAPGGSAPGDSSANEPTAMEVELEVDADGPQQQQLAAAAKEEAGASADAGAEPQDGRLHDAGDGAALAAADAAAEPAVAAATAAAPEAGDRGPRGGGRGAGPGGGRGRGRRGGGWGQPPYSPAAEGCRLVAVRLTLEEAFFMHYVLRCLEVYELQPGSPIPATADHVRLLDTEGLWRACCAVRSNFVTSYAAYHHLKAKGWIPRSGLLYGVDYVVYQRHPVGAHSDFGVLVMPLGPGGGRDSGGPHAPPLGWLDLQITNRLINQVVKKLVLLYMYERPGPDHSTPRCLENFAVEERIVRRWVPDATRD